MHIPIISHYYGDDVRKILMAMGVIMLVGIPFVQHLVYMPSYVTVLAVIMLVLLSGVTNPKQKWVNVVNLLVSVGALYMFGTQSIYAFRTAPTYFFAMNIVLSLLSFIALYFSTKTIRGLAVK